MIPTSNHNFQRWIYNVLWLYIFWFLHQTTTGCSRWIPAYGCISFDSYIKPQLIEALIYHFAGCISFDSYIKPQPHLVTNLIIGVVYLLIPTSNHNPSGKEHYQEMLYIFWFLHQTTTFNFSDKYDFWLYIFWFLHQTTTSFMVCPTIGCCISFDSYIKPQPIDLKVLISSVYQSLFLIRNGE